MKRVYTESKWKKYSASRSRSERKKTGRNHQMGEGAKTKARAYHAHFLTPKNPNQFTDLYAPELFSLSENPEGVLDYIESIRLKILKRNQIFLDKSHVTRLTPDAILLLIASLNDPWFTRGMRISGNTPNDPKLKELFIQSGFLDHVKSLIPRVPTRNLMLHRISKKKVKPSIVKEVCLIGLKHTFGNEEIFEPLYEMLIECMSNTNFHAGLEKQGKFEWWLYVFENPDTKVTSYSFLDLGVGIFESLPVKNYVRVSQFLQLSSNVDLVEPLIAGKIKSRTLAANRGKGIPQLYSHTENKNIKSFKIISNNVFADFDTSNYHKLKRAFRGTFLYWELHPDIPITNGN